MPTPCSRSSLSSQWDLNSADLGHKCAAPYVLESIHQDFLRMPHRNVLDFLVQYFIHELNW
jgi:hypothetical protein